MGGSEEREPVIVRIQGGNSHPLNFREKVPSKLRTRESVRSEDWIAGPMKTNKLLMAIMLAGTVLLQGCVIGFPPLVNVESKESKNENKELMKRLDAIDKRLADLEKQQSAEKKQ